MRKGSQAEQCKIMLRKETLGCSVILSISYINILPIGGTIECGSVGCKPEPNDKKL